MREWLLWVVERERETPVRERETPVTSIDITLKSRVIMHMITSTARRPNASTGKRQEAWRLSARACRDLACRVFECILPWFTQYHFVFECSSAETRSLALELVFECSSAETRSLALERSSLPWFSLSSVRVHDCPAVIYPVPFFVFECSSVRVRDCSLVSLPWFMFECMIVLPWFTQ